MANSLAETRRDRSSSLAGVLISAVLIVGIVYVAKTVLVPLALAVLVTFILTPLVTLVQRSGMKRVPAVGVVVLAGVLFATGVGWGVYSQFSKLADNLPAYEASALAKVDLERRNGHGPVAKLIGVFYSVIVTKPPVPDVNSKPATVVMMPDNRSSLSRTAEYAGIVLEPVGTAGLVIILVIFMLIRREDLRNRMIGLMGHGHLTGTTRVTVEAAHRLSKYLLSQLAVNTAFGLIFGFSLRIIHVPYPLLWGFVTAVLRFVPYVGTWSAASGPILLSFATADGWAQPIAVFVVFFVLDLTTANGLEPVLFGHSTGVSPVALLVAAAFWTWIWGTVGLVLSTPMTVCLVVLGQHAPRLRWLTVLLGDRPALDPHVGFYQRLLANDRKEAAAVVRDEVAAKGLDRALDGVVIPALRRVRRDRLTSGLTATDERALLDSVEKVIADLPEAVEPGGRVGAVLAVASHHRTEELANAMLGRMLAESGLSFEPASSRLLPRDVENLIDRIRPGVVVIAVNPPGGLVQARFLCRRIGKRFASSKVVVMFFGRSRDFDKLLRRFRSAGAAYVTTSLEQTKAQILALSPTAGPVVVQVPHETIGSE